MERQMTEAATLTNEELAILCDIVAGWSVKHSENLNADKRLDHPAALARARKVAARLRKKSFGRESLLAGEPAGFGDRDAPARIVRLV